VVRKFPAVFRAEAYDRSEIHRGKVTTKKHAPWVLQNAPAKTPPLKTRYLREFTYQKPPQKTPKKLFTVEVGLGLPRSTMRLRRNR
ncbi:MAG: hypothetical protein IJ775_05825, partial [Muribaculaceae bacterium]|nr:hypothetical protein [Muribaculaceae bacterium]